MLREGGWGDGVLLKTHFDSWICKIGAHLIYASGGSGAFFLFSEQTSHSVVFFLDQHIIDFGFEKLKHVYHGRMSESWQQ